MNSITAALYCAISYVDKAVFPQNTLNIRVVPKELGFHQPQFAFALDTVNPENSFYVIYERGLKEYFDIAKDINAQEMHVAKLHHIPQKLRPDDLCLMRIMSYDERKTLLGAAVHEVRHRAQYQLNVELIGPDHTARVERCRIWGEIQARHYQTDPNGAREFDAKFFEDYFAWEYMQRRLQGHPKELRSLLLMTPEQFLEREK